MTRNRKLAGAMLACVAILVLAVPAFAVEMTITGKVNKNMQIESNDGKIYTIAEDDIGETVIVYAGKVVTVTGNVEDDGGKKVITVNKFKVVH